MVRDVNGYVAMTGANVRATANLPDPTARVGCQAIMFQAAPANTVAIYVGLKDMDTSTGVGVLGVIPAPADPTTGPYPSLTISQPNAMAGLNLADHYLNGASGNVIVAYTQG